MAEYTFNLHSSDGAIYGSCVADIWLGNRDKTNIQVLAIAQSLFSFLAYGDDESLAAVYNGLGYEGAKWAEETRPEYDWCNQGAVSVACLTAGRWKTAAFTQNLALGQLLVPGKDWFVSDAAKAFSLIQ